MVTLETRKKAKRIRKILGIIDDRIIDLQIIKGGFIMTQKAFRFLLKEHPELRQELEILQQRKFRLERLLFKTA